MVKNVYWTITAPCTFGGNQVVFLRFGHTAGNVDARVNQWKNYCPLPLSMANNFPFIQSDDLIGGLQPDDAVRRLLINLQFNLSQPNTQIDWFVLPVLQPNGNDVAGLVQAAFGLVGGNLTAANIGVVTAQMSGSMNR
ncbi:hypothetical protein DER44DRAFT_739867 [Fusarium oxysporum]|nr:hypothetical protein DER44DRAFT_739867 [Fusarium oxysporum]